ncbi:fungal-specific transcription factor domain-containing protein [Roridomyces roridus]|uniref:Fungal-specific transcription factor domain-containing protein n=1 Tax=Roridomyces roridus TaxID=1738132 RepID=A0AAD7BZP9_9AGAR|nr:fungal-specific transcription factor domain-containing protein [Roridomyces roridus]
MATKRPKRGGGSCSRCKQRKIRCDIGQIPGNSKCSACISSDAECIVSVKPAPDITPQAHVAELVSQGTSYIPDADLRRILLEVAQYARSLEKTESPPWPTTQESAQSEDQLDMFKIIKQFDSMKLDPDLMPYFGRTSHLELVNAAKEARDGPESLPLGPSKRMHLWLTPWERDYLTAKQEPPLQTFPDPDLLESLVSLYFTRINPILLLLHRPSFEQSLASGLHLTDHHFGTTVLCVCALGAKSSDDPRVLLEGTSGLSAGWKYFEQLQPLQKSLVFPITLYEAQTLCLSLCYLQTSSLTHGCWTLIGTALRYVQEIGAHRRNRFANKRVAEAWRRVFWLLVGMDILASAITTRPLATAISDYDVDFPADCDDEQPPGKPSLAAYTMAYLRLMQILEMAQRTIYLVKENDKPEGWPRSAVAAVDSALNAWLDTIPDHLRWDPHIEDPVFAMQSAMLYARYYGVQIHIHRIFLPSPTNKMQPSLHDYPSLAICASSARACSHVMNTLVSRGIFCYPHVLNAVFDSCAILLLHVWRGHQGGVSVDRIKCMQDVELCLRVFKVYQVRWPVAGALHDTILQLMGTTNLQLDVDVDAVENPLKRTAEETDLHSTNSVDPNMLFNSLPMHTEDLGAMPVYEPFNLGTGVWGDSEWVDAHDWAGSLTSVEELMSMLDKSTPGADH